VNKEIINALFIITFAEHRLVIVRRHASLSGVLPCRVRTS
jgi:hypothetical protein